MLSWLFCHRFSPFWKLLQSAAFNFSQFAVQFLVFHVSKQHSNVHSFIRQLVRALQVHTSHVRSSARVLSTLNSRADVNNNHSYARLHYADFYHTHTLLYKLLETISNSISLGNVVGLPTQPWLVLLPHITQFSSVRQLFASCWRSYLIHVYNISPPSSCVASCSRRKRRKGYA